MSRGTSRGSQGSSCSELFSSQGKASKLHQDVGAFKLTGMWLTVSLAEDFFGENNKLEAIQNGQVDEVWKVDQYFLTIIYHQWTIKPYVCPLKNIICVSLCISLMSSCSKWPPFLIHAYNKPYPMMHSNPLQRILIS